MSSDDFLKELATELGNEDSTGEDEEHDDEDMPGDSEEEEE